MKRKLSVQKHRQSLSKAIKWARNHDVGKGDNPYNLDRSLSEAPFKNSLTIAIGKKIRAKNGTVSVFDKGAGAGRMLSEVKQFNPERIHATALTLSKTVKAENLAKIDRVKQGIGLRLKHGTKFDMIYDCFGEDYVLSKSLIGKSIANSISHLKAGGVLFTVIPAVYKPSTHNFTVEEAKRFLSKFRKKRPNLKITARYLKKRIDFVEYVDVVIRIQKP